MITEFCFMIPDKPGQLALIAKALADAGVNIEGISEVSSNTPTAHFHLVVDDENKANKALINEGISFNKKEALLIKLKNDPGALLELAEKLGSSGINITSFYVTMQGKQVLGTDNTPHAKKIVEELGL